MANRTLQFYGYAYGNAPVQLNAHINGQVVFSGAVPTVDQPLPTVLPVDTTAAPVLFSIENSSLFPTEFSGAYPMTVSIATGSGVVLANVFSNYMATQNVTVEFESANSTVTGNAFTVGTLVFGSVDVGQRLLGSNSKIVSGSGSDWTLGYTSTTPYGPTTISGGNIVNIPGTATEFLCCYTGSPVNSDNTDDPRSSVTIDGVPQNPTRDSKNGTWTWLVAQGSTIAYNLNVGLGNVA
jgi:hypothetical protein